MPPPSSFFLLPLTAFLMRHSNCCLVGWVGGWVGRLSSSSSCYLPSSCREALEASRGDAASPPPFSSSSFVAATGGGGVGAFFFCFLAKPFGWGPCSSAAALRGVCLLGWREEEEAGGEGRRKARIVLEERRMRRRRSKAPPLDVAAGMVGVCVGGWVGN